MKVSKLTIGNKNMNYPIFIGSGVLNSIKKRIREYCPETKKIALVIDKNIPFKYKKEIKQRLSSFEIYTFEYSVNENLKSFTKTNNLVEKLLKRNFNRNDTLIAVGGGIIGDFSGFVASITKRGINFINLPTTLLAQVDSSIGGKTGINSNMGKNLIGSFYQPKLVLTELNFLKSLSKRNIICGFAEILKHALIHDSNFFIWIKKNSKNILENLNLSIMREAILKSCKIKFYFVSKDEKEKNTRMILNFGHTFAHAIEAANGFSRKINHGEAVLIGMILATRLSFKKKTCSFSTLDKIEDFYKKNNLPMKIQKKLKKNNFKQIINFMGKDKKNNDERINFILLKKIGKTCQPGKFKIPKKNMGSILKKIN